MLKTGNRALQTGKARALRKSRAKMALAGRNAELSVLRAQFNALTKTIAGFRARMARAKSRKDLGETDRLVQRHLEISNRNMQQMLVKLKRIKKAASRCSGDTKGLARLNSKIDETALEIRGLMAEQEMAKDYFNA